MASQATPPSPRTDIGFWLACPSDPPPLVRYHPELYRHWLDDARSCGRSRLAFVREQLDDRCERARMGLHRDRPPAPGRPEEGKMGHEFMLTRRGFLGAAAGTAVAAGPGGGASGANGQ